MWSVYLAGQIYPLTPPPPPNTPHPPMDQTGVIKTVDLVLLPYISFIIAFTALECIKRE